jgi:SAM-dependent methyltransferase
MSTEWWFDYFDQTYLQRFFVDDEDTVAEVLMLRDLLPDAPADLLDVGCGAGRHSLGLARAGYYVTGLDASADLLERARTVAAAESLTAEFVHADMRHIPYIDCFDAVISMFSSFGYFDDAGNQRTLAAMSRALKNGGRLVMELDHRDRVVAAFRDNEWYELDDGTVIWVRRSFDPISGFSTAIERWRSPDGSEDERWRRMRLYNASELAAMLRSVGLMPQTWFGSTALHTFSMVSPRLIVVAEKDAG